VVDRPNSRFGSNPDFRPSWLEKRLGRHCTNEALHLSFVFVVMNAGADERVQAARGASGERDTWTLMLIAERRSRVWPGASPSFRKVNEPALLDAEIVHADAG
jgi:hypothetical protein